MAATRISDVVVPERFTGYSIQRTMENSVLLASGALVRDERIDAELRGGGITFNIPSWVDLDDDEENVSNDNPDQNSTPNKIGTTTEVQVRLNRNNSWSSMDLAGVLAGSDPMAAIGDLTGAYWSRRLQRTFISVMKGVFAENDASSHTGYGATGDLTHSVIGTAFQEGVTNFNARAYIDAKLTMGDAMGELGLICVHSIVYATMQKNNLIDFIPDSRGETTIPTYQGAVVVYSDSMPFDATEGTFESWLFGRGAVALGVGQPEVPTEIERKASAGNGAGQEILHNRVEWVIHPKGYAYIGDASGGGPTNTVLATATSWKRAFKERKQIRVARLITREFAKAAG